MGLGEILLIEKMGSLQLEPPSRFMCGGAWRGRERAFVHLFVD